VPQLFTDEELERIHEEMRPHLQQAGGGAPPTVRNLLAAFTARTRAPAPGALLLARGRGLPPPPAPVPGAGQLLHH